jgi:hypothetical protein
MLIGELVSSLRYPFARKPFYSPVATPVRPVASPYAYPSVPEVGMQPTPFQSLLRDQVRPLQRRLTIRRIIMDLAAVQAHPALPLIRFNDHPGGFFRPEPGFSVHHLQNGAGVSRVGNGAG